MRIAESLAVWCILSGGAIAQNDQRPQFEVATIKPAAPGSRLYFRGNPGGRIDITNVSLKELIATAWRVQPFQVSGGPAWLDSARFDISAKADHSPKADEFLLMMQSLLEDRFGLKYHRETRQLPIYALTLAGKHDKVGPRMIPFQEGSCAPIDPNRPPAPPEPGKAQARFCGNYAGGWRTFSGVGLALSAFVLFLENRLGRTVIDQTGLTGKFDIDLEWTPDDAPGNPVPPDAPPADNGPSLFTALEEQLGLKLESQKGPVQVLIVDQAEKPSEN